jgi:GNAT superfamily N-acetyltransferase
MVEIKLARIEDLKTIQKLNLMLFEKEKKDYDKLLDMEFSFGDIGTNYFIQRIEETDGFVALALIEGKPVGYLCGGIHQGEVYRKLPPLAELESTFVLPENRSQGIGSMLYKEFINWCKDKGVKKIKVNVSAQNEPGRRFYVKNGFKSYAVTLEHDI